MRRSPKARTSALLLGVALLLGGQATQAVVYSGVLDVPMLTSFSGIYVDLDSQASSQPSVGPGVVDNTSFAVGYSEPVSWDINFFFGGIGVAHSDTFQPLVETQGDVRSQLLNVELGTNIQLQVASQGLGVNAYGISGRPNGGGGDSHFDALSPTFDGGPFSSFTSGQQGYLAFVLNPGASEEYGWMRVTLNNDGSPGTIHDWAYSDDTAFTVGQIPEPAVVMLLTFSSLALLRRRR